MVEEYANISYRYFYVALAMMAAVVVAALTGAAIMNRRIRAIEDFAALVAGRSEELRSAAVQVSDGAATQASSVVRASQSVEEMVHGIQGNARSAEETESTAVQVADHARRGVESVQRTAESTKEISSRITIVDEITRKIELLALNASVEAARAGEHGKGFAVVASEVSKLAEHSKQAASEILNLASQGREQADTTSTMLADLLPQIEKTRDLVQRISASSDEQSDGAAKINLVVQELDAVIRQNASAAGEMAVLADTLSGQSEDLWRALRPSRSLDRRPDGGRGAGRRNGEGAPATALNGAGPVPSAEAPSPRPAEGGEAAAPRP